MKKVDGEAFFITDDNLMPFWEFAGKLWAAAGYEMKEKDVVYIPPWLALGMVPPTEWIYWAFTLGRRQPKISRWAMEWCCRYRTFCIDKAKERLGYRPKVTTDEEGKRAVEWAMQYQKEEKVVVEGQKLVLSWRLRKLGVEEYRL